MSADEHKQQLLSRRFSQLHLENTDKSLRSSLPTATNVEDVKDEVDTVDVFKRKSVIEVTPKGLDPTEIFCLRYSHDSRYLAAGCGDGSVRIYNAVGRLSYTLTSGSLHSLPVTCLRFQPPSSSSSKSKNVLIVGSADGTISHWHMTQQKPWFKIEEADNQIYCCDYRPDGDAFVTAGRDAKVRLYDDGTKTLLKTLSSGKTKRSTGHSNRIYSVKWKPDDPNVILSGGWDNTVQIWDVRVGHSVESIYGPHICGDSIDINGKGEILTGSWRPNKGLEVWDFGTRKKIRDVSWTRSSDKGHNPEMIYAAAFSPDGNLMAAGGSGTNEGKVYDCNDDYKQLDRTHLGGKGVYCLSWAPNGRRLAFAGAGNEIHVLDKK